MGLLGQQVVGLFNFPEAGGRFHAQDAVVVFRHSCALLGSKGWCFRRLNVLEFWLRRDCRRSADVPNQTGSELEFIDHGW